MTLRVYVLKYSTNYKKITTLLHYHPVMYCNVTKRI